MRWNRFLTVTLVVSFLIAGRTGAAERGLRLRGDHVPALDAPVLGTTVEVRVTGIVARARVTQIFKNPTADWLEGIYYFPLPDGAAVDALRMTVGDRVIEGVLQEKREARQTYETAKQQGTKATLIEENRNGSFTAAVANIGPGETIEVAIELQQIVSYAQGRFSLRFPMVLAPKYSPAGPAAAACPQPPVRPVGAPLINPFAFHVDLAPGFPLARVESPTHAVSVVKGKGKAGSERWAADLTDGVAPADSDFVLEWIPIAGREPRAVYFSEEVDGERYSLLMMMPPDDPVAAMARLARETIFVIDTSGSMSGTSIEQARSALLIGLDRLQAGDWFNVIQFNSTADALFPASVPAAAANVERARQYVRALEATGGTEMLPALRIALDKPPAGVGLVPQVIFVTDGLVGNDAEILAFLRQRLQSRRLFTVAIGAATNPAFLRKAAEIGRGTFTAIDSVAQVAAKMGALLAQLDAPVLRQIDVRWADRGAEVWPSHAPDLYLGEPLVLTAREGAAGPVSISGEHNGRSWSDELPAAAEVKGAGIDKLWARRKIDSLTDSLLEGANAAEVRRQVTELGLRHHLVTRWTSLVAVDVEPTAPAGVQPACRVVPVNAPRSLANDAADTSAQAAGGSAGGAPVNDVITVLGETPLLDERRISTGSTVSQADEEKIPAGRDPWAVLQATPSVLTDRINVGGNESGQQSSYVVPGATADQNGYSLDGMIITDLAAAGAGASYFDFDTFEELQVQTGGAGVEQPTAGAWVNLVAQRGTNEWRGSADALWGGKALQASSPANRIDALRDGGAEGGGPALKDRFWLWGSLGRSALDRIVLGGEAQSTVQSAGTVKLNAQLATANSANLLGRRVETSGTGIGAGPSRAPETFWERVGHEDVWKIEDTQIVSSNLYVTATAGQIASLRQDDPRRQGDLASIDEAGVAHGSWFGRSEDRRSRTGSLTGSVFFNAGQLAHELKLGAEERRRDDSFRLTAPLRVEVAGGPLGLGTGVAVGESWQTGAVNAATGVTSLWAQDLVSVRNLTLSLGLRAVEQDLGVAGGPRPWTLTPRTGMTWAFGPERRTLLRASLARFASLLGDRAAWKLDPGTPGFAASFLPAGGAPLFWYADGIDPLRPGVSPNQVDPRLAPEITDEAVLGVEHALRPEFLVGVQATWRRTSHILEERLLIRDSAGAIRPAATADWERAGAVTGVLPGGTPYAAPFFDLLPGLSPTGGRLLVNGDRRQDALGLSLTWQKRHADRWMSSGHITWQDWTWQLGPAFNRFDDPTNTLGSGDDNGGQVSPAAGSADFPHEPARFLGGHWSWNATGLVDLPRGFNLSAALNGRQGVPLAYYRQVARDRAGLADVQITGRADAFRTPDLVTVDARLGKDFDAGDLGISCGLEATNLLNQRATLARELDLGVTRAGRADELVEPRSLRLGVRLRWR